MLAGNGRYPAGKTATCGSGPVVNRIAGTPLAPGYPPEAEWSAQPWALFACFHDRPNMDLLDKLAEQHIRQSIEDGQLDNLEGAGKPLQLDDDRHVPEALRAGYRLLKNAGFVPPEVELRREISSVNQLIREAEPGSQIHQRAERRLLWLDMQLNESSRKRPLTLDPRYADRVRRTLSNRNTSGS